MAIFVKTYETDYCFSILYNARTFRTTMLQAGFFKIKEK